MRSVYCKGGDILRLQMAEISRVLRPGGVYVASTFMTIDSPLGQIFGDENIRPISQVMLGFSVCTLAPTCSAAQPWLPEDGAFQGAACPAAGHDMSITSSSGVDKMACRFTELSVSTCQHACKAGMLVLHAVFCH